MQKSEITRQIIKLGKLAQKGRNAEYLEGLHALKRILEREKRDIEEGIAVLNAKINKF